MSFTVQKHPTLPAIICTLNKDYNVAKQMALTDQAVLQILENADQPLYLINIFDLAISLDEIVAAANHVAHDPAAGWHHPKTKQVLVVTENAILRLAAKGMDSAPFGNLRISIFPTLDEALASI